MEKFPGAHFYEECTRRVHNPKAYFGHCSYHNRLNCFKSQVLSIDGDLPALFIYGVGGSQISRLFEHRGN